MRKNNTNCKKYTIFVQCFLVLFSLKVSILNSGRGKTRTLVEKMPVGWMLLMGVL